MTNNKTNRIVIYLIIFIGTYLALWALEPAAIYKPTGIVLPLAAPKAPIASDNVKLYANAPTGSYHALGLVRIALHYTQAPTTQGENAVQAKAKQLAASIGANGIIVHAFGATAPQQPVTLNEILLRGVAIETPNEY